MKNVTLQSLLFSKIPCTFLAFPPRRNIISSSAGKAQHVAVKPLCTDIKRFKIHVMIQTFEKKEI